MRADEHRELNPARGAGGRRVTGLVPRRRRLRAVPACLAALWLAGCASVRVATDLDGESLGENRQPIAHVHAQNWGVYLFNYIPVVCGNPRHPDEWWPMVLMDRTRPEDAVKMVTQKSKELGAGAVLNLQSHSSTAWIAISGLFWLREVEATGNACK